MKQTKLEVVESIDMNRLLEKYKNTSYKNK